MDPLANNFYALYEIILSDKEYLPEHVFVKYGLMNITADKLKEIETLEMKRLHQEEKLSLRKVGKLFGLTDSGVYRRIQAFDKKRLNEKQNAI